VKVSWHKIHRTSGLEVHSHCYKHRSTNKVADLSFAQYRSNSARLRVYVAFQLSFTRIVERYLGKSAANEGKSAAVY